MRNLDLWRPVHNLADLAAESDAFFDRLMGRGTQAAEQAQPRTWAPPADIWETDEAYFARLDLPGLHRDAVDLSVDNESLRVTGERQMAGEQENRQYYRIERRYGRFERTFTFSRRIDADAIEATFRDGVLDIRIPKAPESRPRRIEIS